MRATATAGEHQRMKLMRGDWSTEVTGCFVQMLLGFLIIGNGFRASQAFFHHREYIATGRHTSKTVVISGGQATAIGWGYLLFVALCCGGIWITWYVWQRQKN
jgi:hypothetical protein